MTTNPQQKKKKPVSSAKMARKNSAVDPSSDDDSYAGVDQISDSEEDEPRVEKVEERLIISSEDHVNEVDSPQPEVYDDVWDGFDPTDMKLFDDNASYEDYNQLYTMFDSAEKNDEDSSSDTPLVRHVRFEDSGDEIDLADDDFFPDPFYPQNALDPTFRREIEAEDSEDSYWDQEADVLGMYTAAGGGLDISDNDIDTDSDSDSNSTQSGTLSGYETDEGETTDEDLPEAAQYTSGPNLVQRRLSNSSSSSEEQIHPRRRHAPPLYSWKHPTGQPFATISANTKKVIMFNLENSHSKISVPKPPTRHPSLIDSSPMISNSGNVMISSIQNISNNMNSFYSHVAGPPEAFLPFTNINADGTFGEASSVYDTSDFDFGSDPNLDEFFDFNNELDTPTDDDEAGNEQSSDSAAMKIPSSTPARPNASRREDQIHPLLSHFDTGVVGSWRKEQNTHQLLHRNLASQESLAFGGNQFMEGTLRGVKAGRLGHANTPITPVRRQRSKSFIAMVASSPSSPLVTKRKHNDGDDRGHKRNKTMI